MRITPLEIQQKQFPMKFRGFDFEEVYAFLEIVREDMEDLLRENAAVKEQIHRAENQIKEYRDMETTLRETLMTAQQMVEDYKTNARKEAELLIREAELKSDTMIKEAQEKVVKIHEDVRRCVFARRNDRGSARKRPKTDTVRRRGKDHRLDFPKIRKRCGMDH